FGPGPELPAARQHPHLGWVALVTNFAQSSSPWVASYADTRVHTKQALRDYLAHKYGTVNALNAAWRSTYTTFDSAGGWGRGSGLFDEDGRHPWVGNERDEMATAAPAVKDDLGGFLYLYAQKIAFLSDAVSEAGVHPVAGFKFWSWSDHWGEKVNFGLVSFSENAYDGWEALRDRRRDAWGFPTGGEERDYGDFLSPVSAANVRIKQTLVGPGGTDATRKEPPPRRPPP